MSFGASSLVAARRVQVRLQTLKDRMESAPERASIWRQLARILPTALVLLAVVAVLTDPGEEPRSLVSQMVRSLMLVFLFVKVSGAIIPNLVQGTVRQRDAQVLMAILSLAATLTLLELVFTFVPRSHGVGYTYGAQNWRKYYWRENELGYRERSPRTIDPRKRIVLTIGDSFTAGDGIQRPRDRFSDVLGRRLGTGYEVINFGRNGADTRAEFENLGRAPWRPRIVILQYYCNDIEGTATEAGLKFPGFAMYRNPLVANLAKSSYLLNFLYWLFPHQDVKPYEDFLLRAYHDRAVFDAHLADLKRFVQYANDNQARLVVVVFPFLAAPSTTTFITQPVGRFFRENGVDVLDVAGLIDSLPLTDRVVNSNNGHPSVKLHRLVAEALFRRVQDLERRL